ncbi:MAG: type III-B CRISPR module RAMP protein Cmr6 [Nitrososphaerota archaeon]
MPSSDMSAEVRDVAKLVNNVKSEEANLWSCMVLFFLNANRDGVMSARKGGQGQDESSGEEWKRRLVEQMCLASKMCAASSLERAKKLSKAASEGYMRLGYHVLSVDAELIGRGLFSASSSFGHVAFEVGLSFDWLLNLPFVAGSSFKGAVRSAWRALNYDGESEAFGGEQVGSIVFMDAYPVQAGLEGYILYPDVLTPHYSREGRDVFDETEACPVPVVYLTVAPGVVFRFQVAVRKEKTVDLGKLLKSVLYAFKMGLGAKTSAGYGVFQAKHDAFKVLVAGGVKK